MASAEQINLVRELVSDDINQDLSDNLISLCLNDTSFLNPGSTIPVFDLYAAASRALVLLASKYKTQFDFSSNDQSLKLSQKRDACLELSNEFARMASWGCADLSVTGTWF